MEMMLFAGLLMGQVGRFQLTPDIAIYLQDIVVCYFVASNVFRRMSVWKKKKLSEIFLIRPLSLVIFVCCLSLITNAWKYQQGQNLVGFLYLVRFVVYMMLYFIIRFDKKRISYWLRWLYALGVGFALLGFAQLVLYPNLRNLSYLGYDPHFNRLFSTLLDPNFAGIIFVLSVSIGTYLLKGEKKNYRFLIVLQILQLVALLLTFSRSSFAAAAAVIVTYILMTKKWKLFIILGELVVIAMLLPPLGGISTSFWRLWSIYGRVENWQEGMRLFLKSPIIGYGFDMLRAIPRATTTSANSYVSNAAGGVDNSIVFILVTTGVIGIVAFGYLWKNFIALAQRVRKKNRALSMFYFAMLIGVFVHSLFVNSMFYPLILVWVWILTAVVEKSG